MNDHDGPQSPVGSLVHEPELDEALLSHRPENQIRRPLVSGPFFFPVHQERISHLW